MEPSKIPISSNTVDKAYDDLLHPISSESGKLLGKIPRFINAALAPLDKWILHQEYSVKEVHKLLEQNLQNVDPEKIVPPEPYVAVPAIQAISYSMNSDELRTLYANLLAKSIYKDTKDSVHPAFVEIIKNLSPLDCRLFTAIMQKPTQEIGYYEIRFGTPNSYHIAFSHVTEFIFALPDAISSSIDNLTRNRLILPRDFHYNDPEMYRPIEETMYYKSLSSNFSNGNERGFFPYKMSIKSSSFGKTFYNICATPL